MTLIKQLLEKKKKKVILIHKSTTQLIVSVRYKNTKTLLLTVLGVSAQQLRGKLLRRDAQRLADLLSVVRLRMQNAVRQS